MATQFSGGVYVDTTFTGAVRSDIQSNLKTQLINAGWTNVAQSSGQGPGNVGTFTVTIASPGVVTFTGHGFLGGERVILQTTLALPTGLSVNTVYFVKFIDANTFNLAATLGGANINTTGSQSGVHTLNAESILLQSATQAQVTNPIRVRLKDNRGNCIQFSIENQAGTVVGTTDSTHGGNLLPAAAKTFEVIATKYHFLCFKQGGQTARDFVMAGMVYVPSFLGTISDHGYMFCDSGNDVDTSIRPSFRSGLNAVGVNLGFQNSINYIQHIWGSNLLDLSYNNAASGSAPQAIFSQFYRPQNDGITGSYRWVNGDLLTSDVLLSIGTAVQNDEAKIRGQFFDMLYISSPFTIDATDTFNSHNWHNITNNNAGASNAPTGGVWVATS